MTMDIVTAVAREIESDDRIATSRGIAADP